MATARELAQAEMESRLVLLDKLEAARDARDEAEAALDAAEREYRAAWSEAIKAQYTPANLRRFGLKEPARKRRSRAAIAPSKGHDGAHSGNGENVETNAPESFATSN